MWLANHTHVGGGNVAARLVVIRRDSAVTFVFECTSLFSISSAVGCKCYLASA